MTLGALVQGIRVEGRAYAGGWWDWLTPFSVFTGFALVVGYALLGATWLVMKTSGELHEQAKRFALIAGAVSLAMIGMASSWTPFLNAIYLERWFTGPTVWLSVAMPMLVGGAALMLYRGLYNGRDAQPFLSALAIFFLC